MQAFADEEAMGGSFGVVGSFPKHYCYGPEEAEGEPGSSCDSDSKPRILLMGLRRSGKSSIQKVILQTSSHHLLYSTLLFFVF